MKKAGTLLWFLCITLLASAQNNFEITSKNLAAGSTISFEYMPRNTVLQGVKDFEAVAYLMEGSMPRAVAVPLQQEGGLFKGTVKTADSTRAVFFTFSKDDKNDNNNDKGYYTLLQDKSGKPVIGAHAAVAEAFNGLGGFLFGLQRDAEKAAELNKKEFENPAARDKLLQPYLAFLIQSKDEAAKERLKTELAKYAEKKGLSEENMMMIKNVYERSLKDAEKAKALMATIKERFPDGAWKRTEMMNTFRSEKTLAGKEKIYKEFAAGIKKPTANEESLMDNMAAIIASNFADSGKYTEAKAYIQKIRNNSSKASSLNNIAWKLAGEGIDKKPIDVKTGLELSALSLAAMQEEKKQLKNKPPYFTEKQYRNNLDGSYYNFVDTYATLLYHNGNFDEAYKWEKEAVEHFKRKNTGMNEVYALLTEKIKGPAAAQAELEAFFEEGKYTPAMKEQLQRLYTAGGKTTAEWTAYVGSIEERAYNKLKAELVKKMINLPAPQFALKDMNGNQVALSSLKGKVVVVDFWATWCGPCIASFPGMQMAVNKFKNNPDVVFLFIDTWENDSNRVQKVTDFIAKNKYDFQVLYDETKTKDSDEFKVVQEFNVEGIPTKFVIDRNNNIRFKSVGFSGSADATVSELTAMIDMAAAESGEPIKKAF
ncbi:MAG TPA: TlpA disulfide reductase family protein [Flavisolibacter sp.]|jgi:peroxiredoxin|nr:TlpA disulfide reductase family protein [Flavisolibacter sp.]